MKGLEYTGLTKVDGPIVILERREDVGLGELVVVYDRDRGERTGRIIEISERAVAVQIFGTNTGLSTDTSSVEFSGTPMEMRVSRDMLGRIFDGLGKPMDGYPASFSSLRLDVNGVPINPDARTYPKDFIQTGISCIDGMNTLIRGQKLPIFSGNGLPHNRLAAQIIRQAKILTSDEPFVMVFAAMGVKYDVARFFIDDIRGERRSFQRGDVPLPGRRSVHRAAHHAAVRAHRGRVSRLPVRHARARGHDRHDELLRVPARGLHDPRGDSLPQRVSRATCIPTSPRCTSARERSRARRAPSRRFPFSRCPTTTSPTRCPTSRATSPRDRSCWRGSSSRRGSIRLSRGFPPSRGS